MTSAMSTGMKEAMSRKGWNQAELGKKIGYSQSNTNRMLNGTRNITKESRPVIAGGIDDPLVYFAAREEATGGVTIPYLNGKHLKRSLSAMKELTQYEVQEALEDLDRVRLHKPAEYWTEEEKNEMEQVMHELLDAAASLQNLVATSCVEYNFSMKKVYKEWRKTVRERGWME